MTQQGWVDSLRVCRNAFECKVILHTLTVVRTRWLCHPAERIFVSVLKKCLMRGREVAVKLHSFKTSVIQSGHNYIWRSNPKRCRKNVALLSDFLLNFKRRRGQMLLMLIEQHLQVKQTAGNASVQQDIVNQCSAEVDIATSLSANDVARRRYDWSLYRR